MFTVRGMDKDVIHTHTHTHTHTHNRILLNHKKEQNCPIYRDMNESTDCHIEWSKLEREKQIPYINIYAESSHDYLEMYQIFFWGSDTWFVE